MQNNCNSLEDLLAFQVSRSLMNLGKTSLVLLENAHLEIKKLEQLLVSMGIDKYLESNFNYQKDRSVILGKVGDSNRECQNQLKMFDIKFKNR